MTSVLTIGAPQLLLFFTARTGVKEQIVNTSVIVSHVVAWYSAETIISGRSCSILIQLAQRLNKRMFRDVAVI